MIRKRLGEKLKKKKRKRRKKNISSRIQYRFNLCFWDLRRGGGGGCERGNEVRMGCFCFLLLCVCVCVRVCVCVCVCVCACFEGFYQPLSCNGR